MEVWLTMIEDDATTTPIVALARDGYSPNRDCQGYQIALTQHGPWLELRYVEEDLCRVIVLRQKQLTQGRLQQVLVVLSTTTIDIYFDGSLVVEGTRSKLDPTLRSWDGSFKLFLMGFNHGYSSSLSMMSIYVQDLSKSEISNLYAFRKPLIETDRMHRRTLKIKVGDLPIRALSQGECSVVDIDPDLDLSALSSTAPHDWIIMVEISSLPNHGLLSVSSGTPVNLHDRFLYPMSLLYKPASGYFNAPNTSCNGTNLRLEPEKFSYRVVALGYDEEVLASSVRKVHQLVVWHVNHIPTIRPPKKQTLLEPDESFTQPGVKIEGIQVIDGVDKDIDCIRVDLWVEHGALVLANPETVDFTTCRLDERKARIDGSTWGCHGNGNLERSMTFVATPSSASRVLSDIVYRGFQFDQADELFIRIYDGVNGPCLSAREHEKRFVNKNFAHAIPQSIHKDTCFEVLAIVPVQRFPDYQMTKAGEEDMSYLKKLLDVDDFSLADGIFWGLLGLVTLCFCASLRRCIRFLGARGARVHVTSDDV